MCRSHPHVWWIKIWEGYLRSKGSQPHARLSSPYRGKLKCMASGWDVVDSFLPNRKVGRGHCAIFWAPPQQGHRTGRYDSIHLAYTVLPHSGVYLNLCPTQLSSLSPTPYLWLSGPRPSSSSSRLWITVWLCLGISNPSKSSSHLQIAL